MAPTTRRGDEPAAADSSRYEAVADLAQRALADDDLETILRETTSAVATVIDARSLAVLERLPGGAARRSAATSGDTRRGARPERFPRRPRAGWGRSSSVEP